MNTALLHFLWQGAAIALALAIALCFAKSPRTRYTLACFALLAMPVVFLATLWLTRPSQPAAPGFVTPFFSIPPAQTTSSAPTPLPAQPINVVPLWISGIVIFYTYRIAGWLAAQRLRRHGVCAAPAAWQHQLTQLATRLHLTRPVALIESALTNTPLTIGVFRPVILIPLGILANLPTQQIEAVLLHELAHIRRHDYFINLAQAAIEGALFYHPAVWWTSRIIRQERELCCDDLVIAATGDAPSYAQALAALEQHRIPTLTLSATGAPLMTRIHRILGHSAPRTTAAPALIFLLLTGSALLFAFHPDPAPEPLPSPAPMPQPAPLPSPKPSPAPKPAPTPAPSPAPQPQTRLQEVEAQLRRELETPYKKWMNEEVVWIISDAERTAFSRLETNNERQMFIEQFWLRRDPTPDTIENEYREEHYRRIAWSNDQFTSEFAPGWRTERGRAYIRRGEPAGKFMTRDTPPCELWSYPGSFSLEGPFCKSIDQDPGLLNSVRPSPAQ
ncbi:MAG: M56 family metallopeptidase [Acidobacteriota bacterium]